MRTIQALVVAMLTSVVLVLQGGPALAREPEGLSDEDRHALVAIFIDHGIEEAHWAGLLSTISSGGLVDADTGADPVSSEVVVRDGTEQIRLEFADHSVAFLTAPTDAPLTAPGQAVPTGVSTQNCVAQIASFWRTVSGCRASYSGISFAYSFSVDYRMRIGYAPQILRAYSPVVSRAVLHNVADVTSRIIRGTASPSAAAHARMSFNISQPTVGSWRTVYLNLYLSHSVSTWSSTNL